MTELSEYRPTYCTRIIITNVAHVQMKVVCALYTKLSFWLSSKTGTLLLRMYAIAIHRRRKESVVGALGGGTMATAEHEPITAVWGQSPQRGPGAEPLVRGSAKPPLKLKAFWSLDVQRSR